MKQKGSVVMERSQQIIGAVEGILRGQGFDVQPDNRLPAHPGVNMLIPLQEDGTELVFTELHFIEGPEGFDVVQIYTTLIDAVSEAACTELEKAAALWNMDFLLGSLGIRRDNHQLYHRYCVTLPKQYPVQPSAELVYDAFAFILSQIAEYHGDALQLSAGITFEGLCAME